MNAHDIVNVHTMEAQAFALVTRLHVQLRREQGRVTDIEYMSQDPNYCRHVLDLAGNVESSELRLLCSKLDALFFGPLGIFPAVESPAQEPARPERVAAPEPQADNASARAVLREKYIGRLR